MTGKRLLAVLAALAVIGIPAGVLSVTCAGRSCEESARPSRIPFCPLPGELRQRIVDGYREGRSPDVLGVANGTPVGTQVAGVRAPWPAVATPTDTRVPLVFAGAGVSDGAGEIPQGVTLDRVAPTIARILGFKRDHPEVRSGTAIDGVADGATRPRLVLLVAWKGIGAAELEDRPNEWPFLSSLFANGAGAIDARTGSIPLDPAATLTTIGTGGLPAQHGITGSFVRNDQGRVVEAFGSDGPLTVIATLADDLEHAEPSSLVGLVGTDETDRGIVGGGWYPDEDPVDTVIGDSAVAPLSVEVHLSTGYGADEVPDVLGVVLDGSVDSMDRWTRKIVTLAERETGGATLVVVAGTGSGAPSGLAVPDRELVELVENTVPGDERAVDAVVPGGLFLDQDVLRSEQVTGLVAVDAMRSADGPDGERLLADAFQGFAVSFSRYC